MWRRFVSTPAFSLTVAFPRLRQRMFALLSPPTSESNMASFQRFLGLLASFSFLVSCGGADDRRSVSGRSERGAQVHDELDAASDSSALAAVELTIPFPEGEPASLMWKSDEKTLYVGDNENNQVWTWTYAGGLVRLATTADPADAKSAGATNVGQIAQLPDGRLLVARFGKPNGGYAGIAYLDPRTKATGLVPNLDPNRKRLGIDVAADSRIFGSYFHGPTSSAVTLVDIASGESDYATGFRKIIGVLAIGDTLYVSDQQADKIYALPLSGPLPTPDRYRVFATLPRPDQICAGPDGSLFTGQFQAAPGSSDPIAVR